MTTLGVSGENAAGDATTEFSGKIRLLLPKVIHAVGGIEMNVYFDNVVLAINPLNYALCVTCEKGQQQSERWTFVPQAADVGDHPFQIEVRDETNAVIARAKSILRVVPADHGAGKAMSLLCIGDSLTHHSVYTQHLLDLCQTEGNPRLILVGSSHIEGYPEENRHEGYGGWTAERHAAFYAEPARSGPHGQRGSSFVYLDDEGKPRVDFARFCKDVNQGKEPDAVTIFLGCNDTFHARDNTIDFMIDQMLVNYDLLVKMIHSVRSETKIGVGLLVPPAACQDAFGDNYGCLQTRWQYRRNQHRLVERLMEYYGNREKENISLVPLFINLDCRHNYPQVTVPCNARTTQIITRLSNGCHPAPEGYRQIGDTFYCWLKAQLSTPV